MDVAPKSGAIRARTPRSLCAAALAAVALGSFAAPAAAEAPLPMGAIPQSFADLADRLSPAVVDITTTTSVADVDDSMRPVIPPGSPFEDFFRDFMDRQPGAPRPQQRSNALGSGFIVSADGYVVTNNHVIQPDGSAELEEVTVTMPDGTEYTAEVVGSDCRLDLAVLKIDPRRAVPVRPFRRIRRTPASATGSSPSATRSASAAR